MLQLILQNIDELENLIDENAEDLDDAEYLEVIQRIRKLYDRVTDFGQPSPFSPN